MAQTAWILYGAIRQKEDQEKNSLDCHDEMSRFQPVPAASVDSKLIDYEFVDFQVL